MFWLNSYLLLVNANFLSNFEVLTNLTDLLMEKQTAGNIYSGVAVFFNHLE